MSSQKKLEKRLEKEELLCEYCNIACASFANGPKSHEGLLAGRGAGCAGIGAWIVLEEVVPSGLGGRGREDCGHLVGAHQLACC